MRKPIVLQVDACQSGLGAVILQYEKPVAMASRALIILKLRMQSSRKNSWRYALDVKDSIITCLVKKVLVHTDHKPLVAIMEKPLYQLSAIIPLTSTPYGTFGDLCTRWGQVQVFNAEDGPGKPHQGDPITRWSWMRVSFRASNSHDSASWRNLIKN